MSIEAGPSKNRQKRDQAEESEEDPEDRPDVATGSRKRKIASYYHNSEKRRAAEQNDKLKIKKPNKKKRREVRSLNEQLAESSNPGEGREVALINSEDENRAAVQAISSSPEKTVTRARKTLNANRGVQVRVIPPRAIDATKPGSEINPQGIQIATHGCSTYFCNNQLTT